MAKAAGLHRARSTSRSSRSCFVLAEIGFRLFWNPKYWIHTEPPAGRLRADRGRKEMVARARSTRSRAREFRTEFRTNARDTEPGPAPVPAHRRTGSRSSEIHLPKGCRSRTNRRSAHDLRSCWRRLTDSRAVVCENFGVSATDLLDYWHRIIHDVLADRPCRMPRPVHLPRQRFSGRLPDEASTPRTVRCAISTRIRRGPST